MMQGGQQPQEDTEGEERPGFALHANLMHFLRYELLLYSIVYHFGMLMCI